MTSQDLLVPKRALISVYDKTGIAEFAGVLRDHGVEILSSGGTARELINAGIPALEVSEYTGAGEMFSGRVKTLHPRIHGGILGRRPAGADSEMADGIDDSQEMERHGISPIDLVCVNLYPFERTVAKPDITLHEALENIDIGGPTLIRSAAKNFPAVCVVTDPSQYQIVITEITNHGGISRETREAFARAAFHHTAIYDAAIARYFRGLHFPEDNEEAIRERILPERLPLPLIRVSNLRYGENPHQLGAYYRLGDDQGDYLSDSEVLQGREISYNNLLDIDTVVRLVREFPGKIAAAVVKHQNPTGVALGSTAEEAYRHARAVDELAAFGNVTAISSIVDESCAKAIAETFVEVVVALDFTEEARAILGKKKSLRLVKTDLVLPRDSTGSLVGVALAHGVLVQQIDSALWDEFRIVSKREPTPEEREALVLAWRVVKHVRSNATVLASPTRTVGTGPGQTSRVDTFRIAVEKARGNARGAVAATDGFCFPDSVEVANFAGITAIIEPGGGRQDEAVIEKADELEMALVMTGMRHFKH